MARPSAGLTARTVQTVAAAGLYADGGGLYLQVTAAGAKTWIFRFQIAGRRRDMGLGSARVVTLAEARAKAQDARRLVAQGIDPIEDRRRQATAQRTADARSRSFRAAAEAYIAAHASAWRSPKHAAQWSATLATYAHPVMGDLPVAEVATSHVLEVLRPIWAEKPETASRVRGRIEAVLDAARAEGARDGENPARWKGHLATILPPKARLRAVTHHAAVPYAAMPALWVRLGVQDGLAARALRLAILTAARTGEVLGAEWAELDIDGEVWTIPAGRMKGRAAHRVPLSAPARDLLEGLATIRRGRFLFPGHRADKHLSNMAMVMVLRRMDLEATVHGFRSTFRTWVAECTTAPDAVAEACLAHVVSDAVIAAYRRSDFFARRRELMDQWAAYLTGRPA